MKVNLKCGKCKKNYDYEVGEPNLNKKTLMLEFEHIPICPHCGVKGEELLSELGQSQMTEWFFEKQ